MKTRRLNLLVLSVVVLLSMFISLRSATADSPNSQIQNSILYVKPAVSGLTCSSWADPCTIQTALGLATDGDQIWVVEGTYVPTWDNDRTATFQLKSGVAIYGGFIGTETSLSERDWEYNVTTLSGDIGTEGDNSDNSFHVVTGSGVDPTAILDGFTITAGNANMGILDDNRRGGGITNVSGSPTLTNLIFSSNTADEGAGMANFESSSPILTSVTFSSNTSLVNGGGMSNRNNSSPILNDVTFNGNSAVNAGGGMFNFFQSSPILNNVVFSANIADDPYDDPYSDDGKGGGMFNQQFSSPVLANVTFDNNSAEWFGGGMVNDFDSSPTLTEVIFSNNSAIQLGGGMANIESTPTLTNVIFNGNTTTSEFGMGGGMVNSGTNAILMNVTFSNNITQDQGGGMVNFDSSPSLTNVTFSNNSATSYEGEGGGMFNYGISSPTLTNVTFTGNSATIVGGGMSSWENSSPIITNSIFWDNTPDQINNAPLSTSTITYSNVQGSDVYPGMGNINQDPLLGPLADNGGFTQTHALGPGSPAIDAGDPTNCPATDQRGFPRPIDGDGINGPRCDIGAYEAELKVFDFSIYLPSVLK